MPAPWALDPALSPVWTAARSRLERNGLEPVGTITVDCPDRSVRHAVSGLLGRPVLRDRVRIDLGLLDAVARERAGTAGVVALVEAVGGPLRDRVAERSAAAAARQAPYAALRSWLADHPAVAAQPWVEPWLAGVRRSGLLARVTDSQDAGRALVQAAAVAAGLLGEGDPVPTGRNVLAARVAGDAHALDDGTVLGALVLRALAAAVGEEAPRTAAARRALWERHGVRPDAVSGTCLTLGLRPAGRSALAHRLALAADDGDPVHLTAWDLARADVAVPAGTRVLVCENPRVLEAIAERRGGAVPVVCTSGMPGLVTSDVLRQLRAGGAHLDYHGDFDWPGVAIANRLVATAGCRPWRMSAEDYQAAVRADGPALLGAPVAPEWDPALGEAMRRTGRAVHEEAVLDSLLDHLW